MRFLTGAMTPAPLLTQKKCWIVSDGRRGIENQALGLAEAVRDQLSSRGITLNIERVVARKDGYVTLPDGGQPDLWIGCGRAAIPLARKHRHIFPDAFFVYVQDPRTRHKDFDLIIAPAHDRLAGSNIVEMIGSPNRVSQNQLEDAHQLFPTEIENLPGSRAAILIGGDSKRFQLDDAIGSYLIKRLQHLIDQNVSLMITVSRRTPDPFVQELKSTLGDHKRVWLYDGEGENPYFAFLAAADWIFVTEESTNMLVEASSTGKPVYVLPLYGKPGKFALLHADLEGYGSVRPYLGTLDKWNYPALNETRRVADLLITRWKPENSTPDITPVSDGAAL